MTSVTREMQWCLRQLLPKVCQEHQFTPAILLEMSEHVIALNSGGDIYGAKNAVPSRRDLLRCRIVAGITVATLAVFCLLYWIQAIHTGSRLYLGADDVFTLWMTKVPSVVDALKAGADTAPPPFYFLTRLSCRIFGFTPLGLRVPAMMALFVFFISTFFLLRKHVGDAVAGAAGIVALLGNAGATDLFARPPAMMMMSFSLMSLIWAGDSSANPKRWRSILLACLIAFSITIHFYSVVFVPLLLMMELAWATNYRKIRKAHWIGILAGSGVLLLLLPVILPVYKATHTSAQSAGYYAHPVPAKIISYVSDIAFQKYQVISLMALLVLAGIFRWLQLFLRQSERPRQSAFLTLGIVGFIAGILPIVTYIFAILVTRVYNERYIDSFALALAVGFAFLVRNLRWPKELELVLLICVVASYGKIVLDSYRFPIDTQVWYEVLVHRAPGNEPIVLPDGGSFFETQESSNSLVRSRTAYLFLPKGMFDPDTEPARIAHAWKKIRPELPIYENEAFLAQHKSFYILTFEGAGQELTSWARANFHTQIVSIQYGASLIYVSRD